MIFFSSKWWSYHNNLVKDFAQTNYWCASVSTCTPNVTPWRCLHQWTVWTRVSVLSFLGLFSPPVERGWGSYLACGVLVEAKQICRKLLAVCGLRIIQSKLGKHLFGPCPVRTTLPFVEFWPAHLNLRHITRWMWPFSCAGLWRQRFCPSIRFISFSSSQP